MLENRIMRIVFVLFMMMYLPIEGAEKIENKVKTAAASSFTHYLPDLSVIMHPFGWYITHTPSPEELARIKETWLREAKEIKEREEKLSSFYNALLKTMSTPFRVKEWSVFIPELIVGMHIASIINAEESQ